MLKPSARNCKSHPFGEGEVLEDGEVERPGGRTGIGLQSDVAFGQAERLVAWRVEDRKRNEVDVLNHSLGLRPPDGACVG